MTNNNLTQDSGIHTMSSRRDSAFSDGMLPHNTYDYNMLHSRKANSDCYPSEIPCHSGRLTHSMEYANRYQPIPHNYVPLGKDHIDRGPVYSNYGSNCDPESRFSYQDLPASISQCSNNCYHPNDPGGGLYIFIRIKCC